jgi:acyl carrier protein
LNFATLTKEIVAVVENHLGYNMENLEEQIKDIMAKSFLIEREKLLDEANLESLGVDSLGVFEMVINIEDEFNFELSDKEMLKFKTVGEAVQALKTAIESR